MEKGERNKKIDGLRGLLALMVALNHSFMVLRVPMEANIWGENIFKFHDWQSKLNQLFMFLGNGGMAVMMFFLISGLVLQHSWDKRDRKDKIRSILEFYKKRFWRLYPTYALIVVAVAVYMMSGFSYKVYPAAADWFNWWMNFKMNWQELGLNLAMIHLYVGGVTWTLRVILIASVFFPLIYWLNKRISWKWDTLIVLVMFWLPRLLIKTEDFIDLNYIYLIYLGAAIPKWRWLFEKEISRVSLVKIGLGVGIVLGWWSRYQEFGAKGVLVEGVIVWAVLGWTIFNKKLVLFGFLEKKCWQFLGKISYHFYLVHFTVLYLLARLMLEKGSNFEQSYYWWHLGLFLGSSGISIFVGWMMWKVGNKINVTNK